MRRRAPQFARLPLRSPSPHARSDVRRAWAGLAAIGAIAVWVAMASAHRGPARRMPAPRHNPTPASLAAGIPVRLANLTPAVIFADASTLSYRSDAPDASPVDIHVADRGRSRSAPLRGRAADTRAGDMRAGDMRAGDTRAAAADACPADDDADALSGRETTVTLFFAADSAGRHGSGEYVLWRQTDDSAPVPLVHHVLRDGTRPFLTYEYVVPTGSGADSLALVPHGVLPISRADTIGSDVDVRSLRAVEWRFLVVLDSTTHPVHMARVHVVTSLPAIDRLDRHECREASRNRPLFARGSTAAAAIVARG